LLLNDETKNREQIETSTRQISSVYSSGPACILLVSPENKVIHGNVAREFANISVISEFVLHVEFWILNPVQAKRPPVRSFIFLFLTLNRFSRLEKIRKIY
jgi:hypothetical protein